jgi:hypothetical protein
VPLVAHQLIKLASRMSRLKNSDVDLRRRSESERAGYLVQFRR